MPDFLRDVFDDPSTGFVGRDKLFDHIKQRYIGVSRTDIASFLRNFETQQVHAQIPQVTIHRPQTHYLHALTRSQNMLLVRLFLIRQLFQQETL